MRYFDKTGKEIKEGMQIKMEDGTIEKVFACGDDDLGIQATSEAWLKYHPDSAIEYYPLYQFNMAETEIID